MYNAEFKQRYLEENKLRNMYLKLNGTILFNRSESYEEEYGKDLYDFTVKEILDYYKSLCTPSLESLMVMNNQYKLYTAYALKESLIKDCQNHYDEIDNLQLNNCVNTALVNATIISKKELLHILNSSAIENISEKFMCLALFEGICGKDCADLTELYPENFDIVNKTVKLYSGKELIVSQQLIDWALESANEYEYFNNYSTAHNKTYLQTDRRIIKSRSNASDNTSLFQRHKTINRRIVSVRTATSCAAIGIGTLQESGRIQMIRDLMETGKTLDEAIRDKEQLYRYGNINSYPRYILKYGLAEE